MTRGGKSNSDDALTRRCIATGAVQPTDRMIRFVPGPEGDVVPDLACKLPGRGIWVTSDRAALTLAVKKKLFSRSAKMQLKVADDLVDQVEALLLRRTQDTLALARKASQAITGYEKVRGWLELERARVLIQAKDGSTRGKTKLRAPVQKPGGPDTFIGHLTAEELGMAFGRDRVIHAALGAGGLGKRVVMEASRLQGIRKDNDGNGSVGKEKADA